MSTSAPRDRQPRGIPVGGQFATSTRAESGLSLDEQPDAASSTGPEHGTFDITVHGHYVRDEIPPRHRKPRPVAYAATAVVSVPSVTGEQAPVAIEVQEGSSHDEVRFFGGHLFEPHKPNSGQTEPTLAGEAKFANEVRTSSAQFPQALNGAWNQESFEAAARDKYEFYLVVDGEVWRETGEPRYVVQTFGLGGNHGGTSVGPTTSDNYNISADSYFRADDFEAARSHALHVAAERGDTESVERIRRMDPPITVHDPSALRLVTPVHETPTVKQSRHDFASATRDYERHLNPGRYDSLATPEEEKAAWERLVAARQALLAHTDDVTGVATQRRPYEDRDDSDDQEDNS